MITDDWHEFTLGGEGYVVVASKQSSGTTISIASREQPHVIYDVSYEGNGLYRRELADRHFVPVWITDVHFGPGELVVSQDLVHAVIVHRGLKSPQSEALVFLRDGKPHATVHAGEILEWNPVYEQVWWQSRNVIEYGGGAYISINAVTGQTITYNFVTAQPEGVVEVADGSSAQRDLYVASAIVIAVVVFILVTGILVRRNARRKS